MVNNLKNFHIFISFSFLFSIGEVFSGDQFNTTKDAYIAIHSTKQSTKMLTKKYFSRLDSKIASELYQMFQMDFEMFDYDVNSYIK